MKNNSAKTGEELISDIQSITDDLSKTLAVELTASLLSPIIEYVNGNKSTLTLVQSTINISAILGVILFLETELGIDILKTYREGKDLMREHSQGRRSIH